MVSKNQILNKLKKVIDPELNVNIVDLGLIYDVSFTSDPLASPGTSKIVKVKMTLTSPGCPLSFVFDQLVTQAVKEINEIKEVKIELTFDPPWSPVKMTEEAKLELGWTE